MREARGAAPIDAAAGTRFERALKFANIPGLRAREYRILKTLL